MSIASLPMYNLPEMRPALDRLWRAIAERLERDGLPAVPERLAHGRPLAELWSDPALFLSQCCGNDIVSGFWFEEDAGGHVGRFVSSRA